MSEYGPVSELPLNERDKLAAYAFPGGYPVYYLDADDEPMCSDCAQAELDAVPLATTGLSRCPDGVVVITNPPVTWFIYWEGPPMQCVECNKELTSAYGDPDEDEECEAEEEEE